MLNMNSININGVSRIDGRDVAYFNASFSGGINQNQSFTESISDETAYRANQSICDADYDEFKAVSREYADKMRGISGEEGI